jgi:predicted dehydrogenase
MDNTIRWQRGAEPVQPLRIAVAGAGTRAGVHLEAIATLPRYWRLVGVCDVRPERAQEAGGLYDAPAYADPLTMLDETKPDALYVVVPPDGHHPLTLAAAERGIHVITEVPISISLALADLMIEACHKAGVVLEVAESVLRSPREQLRQEVMRRGLLGPPTLGRMTYGSGSYHGMSGVLALLGGTPESAWGWAHDLPTVPYLDFTGVAKQEHDWEAGTFRWPDDKAAGQPGPTLLYEHPPRPFSRSTNGWEVVGPRGLLVGEELVLLDEGGGRPRERRFAIREEMVPAGGMEMVGRAVLDTDPPVVWENPLVGRWEPTKSGRPGTQSAAWQLVSFYESIVEKRPAWYGAAAGRRDIELLIALRDSARRGSVPVDLPLRGTTAHEEGLHEQYRRTYGHDPVREWREALTKLYPRGGITHGVL